MASETTNNIKGVLSYIAGALLAIVLGVSGTAYMQLSANQDKLEQRIYVLQKESVSESKLKDTEDRINANTAAQIQGVRTEVQLMNKYLEKLMEEIRTNK